MGASSLILADSIKLRFFMKGEIILISPLNFIMNAPESFIEKLDTTFRGRLRIRWSPQRHAWLIEQKVKRGLFGGFKPTKRGWDESIDRYVQTRDGVIEIMEVRTGTLMDCPKCGHELKVPFMHTTAIRCGFCRLKGLTPSINAVYLPLNDTLIDYLKSIDPENPISESNIERMDRENNLIVELMEKDAMNAAEAGLLERFNRIAGIGQWGYTKDTNKFRI